MAFAFVQSAAGTRVTSGTTITATWTTANVTAGNLLLAVISRASAGSTPSIGTVSDTAGNKWRHVSGGEELTTGRLGFDIWCCEAPAGGTKPTVTATINAYPAVAITGMNMEILEYSGASGYELIDAMGVATTTTTSISVATGFATTQANDLVLSVVTGDMSAATVPSGWTSRLADATQKFWIAEQLTSSAAIQTAAWTGLTSATKGCAAVVAFRQVGATSGPNLLQTSLYEPAVFGSTATSRTGPAMTVNPAVGNTLVAVVNLSNFQTGFSHGCQATALTDTAGNTWHRFAATDEDNQAGNTFSLWICPSALGGSTALTVTSATPTNGLTFLMLEFAHCPPSLIVDSQGAVVDAASSVGSVSTTAAVQAGGLAFLVRGNFVPVQNYQPTSAGWTQIMSDSNGGITFQMNVNTAAGVLTGGTGTGGNLVDQVVVALCPAPSVGLH